MGNQLTDKKVKAIRLKDSLPYDIQPEVVIEEIKVNQPESLRGDSEAPQTQLDL